MRDPPQNRGDGKSNRPPAPISLGGVTLIGERILVNGIGGGPLCSDFVNKRRWENAGREDINTFKTPRGMEEVRNSPSLFLVLAGPRAVHAGRIFSIPHPQPLCQQEICTKNKKIFIPILCKIFCNFRLTGDPAWCILYIETNERYRKEYRP